MYQPSKIHISSEGERLLEKIAQKGGYSSQAAVLEVIIREAAHFRNIPMEFEETEEAWLPPLETKQAEPTKIMGSEETEEAWPPTLAESQSEQNGLEMLQASLSADLRQQIAWLNKQTNPRGRHLQNLHTGGTDAFSALNMAQVEVFAGDEAVQQVKTAFPDNIKQQIAILRWVLRGLSTRHAIAKAIVSIRRLERSSGKSQNLSLNALQLSLPTELRERIVALNQQDHVRDSELYTLRSGSGDMISKLKPEQLADFVSQTVQSEVKAAFPNWPSYQISILRWVIRGLKPELAIRKENLRLQRFARTR